MENLILQLALWAVPVILAITLHEAAHGYVAKMRGDPTAYQLGRITLNPFKHIDRVGTLIVPGVIVLMNALTGASMPVFGWAKPVPVDFRRLHNPKADMLWVAAAGPGSNFVQAFLWALALSVFSRVLEGDSLWLVLMQNGMVANLVLMLVNLVPVPPLDGGRILVSLLPMRQAVALSRVEPYGFFILIALLYLNVLDVVLGWFLPGLFKFLLLISGV
ncbi:MAG: site-2 protease family protein [Uliginosibacterium sp.]|jgi:Zn-dependent protease|nr:site-2 protease family protein [Uliginosibacterium sp.]MBK9616541.1 site-2 protease family protein [Uliginosibacterium sp.]